MIIKPYSGIALETFVPANYPSVRMFLKCNDTGAGLYDEVSKTTFPSSTGEGSVTKTGTKIVNAAAATRTWTVPTINLDTAKYHMLVSVFEYATGAVIPAVTIGAGAAYIQVGGTANAISDGTDASTSTHTGTVVATIYGGVSRFKAGATGEGRFALCSQTAFDATTNCNVVNATAGDIDAAMDITTFSLVHVVAGSVSCYLSALISLSAEPSDLFVRSMLTWMTKEAALGVKAIYPGLKGMT